MGLKSLGFLTFCAVALLVKSNDFKEETTIESTIQNNLFINEDFSKITVNEEPEKKEDKENIMRIYKNDDQMEYKSKFLAKLKAKKSIYRGPSAGGNFTKASIKKLYRQYRLA